jgi:uncharacterized Fe-S cluster protein YjdI
MGPQKEYEGSGIVVGWEPDRCIHARECVNGLPGVFDPGRRPWIDPSGVAGDEVAEVIRRCPSGALTYRPTDPTVGEEAHEGVEVRVVAGGPLIVRGEVRLRAADGTEVTTTPRATLCRCGGSANKPFCDGSHRTNGFEG